MDEHKDINNRLDELFAKARTSKPVMGVDEVRNLIATAPVTATASTDKSPKSNFTLYMLLGGIAIITITAGIWFYLESDKNPSAVSQTSVPLAVTTESNSSPNVNTDAKEQESQTGSLNTDVNNNETAATDSKPVDEAAPSKVNEKSAVKSQPGLAEKEKTNPAETNSEISKNKTYLVTGGDFVVNFQTDEKTVKMKLNEDNVKELNIDGKVIANAEYPKYKDIIEQGKKMMIEEKAKSPSTSASTKSPEEQKRDEINTRLFTAFTDQLKKDKLINEDKYSFKLTATELLIDGKPQPDAVRQKYIDLFKSTAGRDIGGATFKFDHGMN